MRTLIGTLAALFGVMTFLSAAAAQPPAEAKKDFSNSSIVTHMMAFDTKNTGKLTKDMVTDARLHRLFDKADANQDGIVTKEELMALAAKLESETPPGGGFGGKGPKGKGPGGKGPPPDGKGPGGNDKK